ncbi:hypothetical protein ACFL2Q_20165 [Thermodesulfobacteriota bacterium]
MKDVDETLSEAVDKILEIARETLLQHGSHLPTVILHTLQGTCPMVLPFKDAEQKKAMLEFVKKTAVEKNAYAVTTVTCARIVDSRTGEEEESLVVTTAVQGGGSDAVVQSFIRDAERHVIAFGDAISGDHAAMPGQLTIFPPWEDEIPH